MYTEDNSSRQHLVLLSIGVGMTGRCAGLCPQVGGVPVMLSHPSNPDVPCSRHMAHLTTHQVKDLAEVCFAVTERETQPC